MLDSIKDLVSEANFECSGTGFSLQAMDSSHVSLVSLNLKADGFEHFRCDRPISMGMNLGNMAKCLKVRGVAFRMPALQWAAGHSKVVLSRIDGLLLRHAMHARLCTCLQSLQHIIELS